MKVEEGVRESSKLVGSQFRWSGEGKDDFTWEYVGLRWGLENQIVNISGFVGQAVSVTTTGLCLCWEKTAIDQM